MCYKHFKTAVFCTKYDIDRFDDMDKADALIDDLLKQVHVDKLYLESFRSSMFVDESKIRELRRHVEARGLKTAGAITLNVASDGHFKSFCYSNEAHQALLIKTVEHAASLFDEVILDDFYFTNCKCEACIKNKGDQSWSEFRTALLFKASQTIMETARRVNEKAHMIIKYPNWYEDYQSTGYHVKESSEIFDAVYTGTETRDSKRTQQNLQPYLSYFLMRYMENVKPGHNDGGWFDTYDCFYNPNRYLEQLNLTLFAKAKEATLFCMGNLLGQHDLFVPLAGYGFKKADEVIGQLGAPQGIACYKPYDSKGENYIHNFIGLLGLPLEPKPFYDMDSDVILLTESAAYDTNIVDCIHEGLMKGQNVIVTSGLLEKLQNTTYKPGQRHIHDIAEIDVTNHSVTFSSFAYAIDIASFKSYEDGAKQITMPQIAFSTNDTWQEVVGIAGEKSYPLLLSTEYGNGCLYVLTVPENYTDFYLIPQGALNHMRQVLMKSYEMHIEGPSQVGLFLYDNNTMMIHSFRDASSKVTIVLEGDNRKIEDLVNNRVYTGVNYNGKTCIDIFIEPRRYKGYKYV